MPARPLAALALFLCAVAARASGTPAVAGFPPSAVTTTSEVDAAPAPAAHPVSPPRSNESMEFQVSYLGVPMGKVRLFAGAVDATVAPVFLQAQTTSVFAIVTLKQQLSSYLDVETGLPRSGQLDAVEGSYRHTDWVSYDRAANKAKVRQKGKYDNTYVLDVPADATDFIGLVYRLRTLPLEPGAQYAFNVLAGRHQKQIVATVQQREQIETKAGTFQAVKVRVPTGFTGKFSEKDPTYVWFSDDDRRMVVRIVADFAIGNATANLTSYVPGAPPTLPAAAPRPVAAESGGTAVATP